MFFTDLMFALVFALIFWMILGVIFGRESWGFPFTFLLIILFMLTWVGGIWMTPIGVAIWDSYWLSFLIVAFFLALLFAAITPPKGKRPVRKTASEIEGAAVIVGGFFWILLAAAVVGILVYYI